MHLWRLTKVAENAISFGKNNPAKMQYWDQDALNATLIGQWIILPTSWNWQFDRRIRTSQPAIVHFVTHDKPWRWSNRHPFKREYRKYRRKTPWRDYQEEGQPNLPSRVALFVKGLARAILPHNVRQWLRARTASLQRQLALAKMLAKPK